MIKNLSKTILLFAVLSCFILPELSLAQKSSPKAQIKEIINSSKGTIGVAVVGLEEGFSLTFNKNEQFPMMSVYKFPVALAVLDQIDKGKLSLGQIVRITKSDLRPGTWSPLREDYPNGVDISLGDLLGYTISKSDNNGCDVLFQLLGGTNYVQTYIHRLGVKGIAIAATEAEMAEERSRQYTNWSKPSAMRHLIVNAYRGKYLSKPTNDFLWKIMTETSTGPDRIKGLLPAGTVVAHKTGTSNTNDVGLTAATNDAGIVTLPDGRHFAIVVFVKDSTDDEKTREAVIARVTKVIWDHFSWK